MHNSLNLFLTNNDQWETLTNRGLLAEMMLAKNGQLLTPALQYGVVGLNENALYRVSIEIQRIDDKIYDFGQIDGKWVWWHKSNATTVETAQVVQHKDGPQLGSYWIKNGLDFSWLKLTNKRHFVTDRHAFVEPRQQYQPIVRIEDINNPDVHFIYSNQDQVFITVTAFVSDQFLELKDMWIKSRKKAEGPKKRSSGGDGGTVEKKQKKEMLKQFQQIPVEQSYDQGYTSDQSFPEELNAYPQLQQIGYHQEHQQPNYWNNVKHENAPYLFQN
uniref:T-box domain-containing protein n=1 Tax=Caenorhabditis japonica TaxID=281687 RepID=A0A8R1I4E3_CAEJA